MEKKRHVARRNARIMVVLNDEEKKQIIKQAEKEGLLVSTYIRWKLLKKGI